MKVSLRSIIGRIFIWNYEIMNENPAAAYRYRTHGTNLCHLVRTVFVAVPLKILLLLIVATGIALLFGTPFREWGFLWGLAVYGVVVGGVALIAGAVLFFKWLMPYRMNQPRPPSVVGAWLAARKARICPLVKFTE